MGDRHDRQAELRIKLDDAVFVGRHIARRAPRAFGIDDQLARIAGQLRLGGVHHRPERLGPVAAIDRYHTHLQDVPAEERDPGQFALEDVERVVEIGEERDRIPEGLVLRRQDEGALRQVFHAGNVAARAGQRLVEPQARARPEFRNEPRFMARRQEIQRRPDDHLDDQTCIECQVEGQRTDMEHRGSR